MGKRPFTDGERTLSFESQLFRSCDRFLIGADERRRGYGVYLEGHGLLSLAHDEGTGCEFSCPQVLYRSIRIHQRFTVAFTESLVSSQTFP